MVQDGLWEKAEGHSWYAISHGGHKAVMSQAFPPSSHFPPPLAFLPILADTTFPPIKM